MSTTTPSVDYREFKVVSVSSNANSFGLHGHILLARDGKAFAVGRSRGPHLTSWNKGDVIKVPLLGEGKRLGWEHVNVEIPRELSSAPPNVVKEIWGE